MKRATSQQDKAQRKSAILESAATLLEQQDYHQVTVAQIAKHCGLAKGTVYLYFSTKEELFLQLLTDSLLHWFLQLQETLETLEPGPLPPNKIADLLTGSLAQRPQLLSLLPILHTTLEQNVDQDAARRFKLQLRQAMIPIGQRLDAHLPQQPDGQGLKLLIWFQAAIVGLHQMTHPNPILAQVLEQTPELQTFQLDFYHELHDHITTLIAGLQNP